MVTLNTNPEPSTKSGFTLNVPESVSRAFACTKHTLLLKLVRNAAKAKKIIKILTKKKLEPFSKIPKHQKA